MNSITAIQHRTELAVLPLSIETCLQRATRNIDRDIDVSHGTFSIRLIDHFTISQDKISQLLIEGRLGNQLILNTEIILQKQDEHLTAINYNLDIAPYLIYRIPLIVILVFVVPIIAGFLITGMPLCLQFLVIVIFIACLTFLRIVSLRDIMFSSLSNSFSKPSKVL